MCVGFVLVYTTILMSVMRLTLSPNIGLSSNNKIMSFELDQRRAISMEQWLAGGAVKPVT